MPRRFPWPSSWGPRSLVEPVDGGYRVNLDLVMRRVLHQALDDLRVMLAEQDPATRRLTPTAYLDEPALDEEYHRMIGQDLVSSQLAAFDVVERSIDGTVVDRSELESWMRAVNAVRLVIGTQLDVGEQLPELDRDDPAYPRYAVYEFLGTLLYWIVDALSER